MTATSPPARPKRRGRPSPLTAAVATALGQALDYFGITAEELASLLDLPPSQLAAALDQQLDAAGARSLLITLVHAAASSRLDSRPVEGDAWALAED